MTVFLKFSNCCIITNQITYFVTIQYDKIYFSCSLVQGETSYNKFPSFFRKIFSFKMLLFSEIPIFVKFCNCRIITDQNTYFVTIEYDKIYFSCSLICGKTRYNEFAQFFLKIFPFQISIFFKNDHFFSNFQIAAKLPTRLPIFKHPL